MRKYLVTDSEGHILRSFPTYQQAMTYKISCGRYDWEIR